VPGRLLLAIETATRVCSVALARGALVLRVHANSDARLHSERLLPMLDALLGEAGAKLADVEAFALSIGPGSFTGLRIGLATVKAFAHADVPFERLRDPEAIAFWPSGIGRDGARTPMPWSRDANMAGFTNAADAWLPLDPRHRALAVDTQGEGSMLAFTREMIALRRASPALREGAFIVLDAPEPVLAFERVQGSERVLCQFNLGPDPVVRPVAGGTAQLAIGIGHAELRTGAATLGGYSALLVAL